MSPAQLALLIALEKVVQALLEDAERGKGSAMAMSRIRFLRRELRELVKLAAS